MKRGLPSVEWPHAKILILGSLPGDESLRLQQYYANRRNHFWILLARVYDANVGAAWDERLSFLESKGIALWDVLLAAEREGSLDGKIRNPIANDLLALVDRLPQLRTVVLNGGKAASLFDLQVRRSKMTLPLDRLRVLRMPSSSPVPGRNVLTLDAKVERWRTIVN